MWVRIVFAAYMLVILVPVTVFVVLLAGLTLWIGIGARQQNKL